LFVLLLVGFVPLVLFRSGVPGHTSDFPLFWESGRYVLQNAARHPGSNFHRYWPSLDAAMAVLAWMPLLPAACVWCAIGGASFLGLLASTRRYLLADCDPTQSRQAVLAAGLLVMPLVLDHLCLGSFHILMAWLTVAGLGRVSRGKDLSGGILLGLAIWVKLLPLAGAGYLLLKRKWVPALVAVACALLVNAGLSLAAFGPKAAWELNRQWWQSQAVGTTDRLLTQVGPIDEDRYTNQSTAVFVRRVFSRMGYQVGAARQWVSAADLSGPELRAIYLAFIGAIGLGVLTVCRRPANRLGPQEWATQIALVLLATLWFSPVIWSYHPIAAAPALAVVLARKPAFPRTAWLVVGLWLSSMILLAIDVARLLCVQLWASMILGVVLTVSGFPPPHED
jgi:hypothetical protein